MELEKYSSHLERLDPISLNGGVCKLIGLTIECTGPEAELGELCSVYTADRNRFVQAEVVGFREDSVLLMPLGDIRGIGPGCEVVATGGTLKIPVGDNLLGRVLDGLGHPIDGGSYPLDIRQEYPVQRSSPNPLSRQRITEPLSVGVKAIDGLVTCGRGQRMGVFAGSGVGKSVLLGMMARNTDADINVIGLIGERGREVKEFVQEDLGPEGLERSVVVAATSDAPALVRIRGAMTATSIAEYFRDQGLNVLLLMDSVTRFAMAQRELGLAVGEPPTTKGYTPSVFALLPRLLERAGTAQSGSITGLYTVLVEGDDMEDPIADAVRSILDGHVVLARRLAERGHYPAVDVLQSVSRLMEDIVREDHRWAARRLRHVLSVYEEAEDLINIGAYEQGNNPEIDAAIHYIEPVREFLQQDIHDGQDLEATISDLQAIFA